MEIEKFQRYVWTQSQRKRQINREKYESVRKKYLENELAQDESSTAINKIIWPGEFEDQLKKRKKKVLHFDSTPSTPAVQTPSTPLSDSFHSPFRVPSPSSISSNNDKNTSKKDRANEKALLKKKKRKKRKRIKVSKVEPDDESSMNSVPTFFPDDYLDFPVPHDTENNSFFLASSNLISKKP